MVMDEDYEFLAWENKVMALFLNVLGLTDEEITDLVVNGGKEERLQAVTKIKKELEELTNG